MKRDSGKEMMAEYENSITVTTWPDAPLWTNNYIQLVHHKEKVLLYYLNSWWAVESPKYESMQGHWKDTRSVEIGRIYQQEEELV